MRLLRGIFRFYINSSVHVALAVCALVGVTALQLDILVDGPVWAVVFFGSITGYNFVKYAKIAGLHHRSLTDSLRSIQVFSFICFAALVFFSWKLTFGTLICLAFFGALTLFYAVPVVASKNLRTLGGLKILIVALVWAGVTVLAPRIESATVLDWTTVAVFAQRVLVTIVLTLPFEIRDHRFDKPELRTLPHVLGIARSKQLGYVLIVLIAVMQFFIDAGGLGSWIAVLGLGGMLGLGLRFAKREQSRYYASFWVEAIPIGWLGLLWLAREFTL